MENAILQLLKPNAQLMVMLPLRGMQQIVDAKMYLLNRVYALRVSIAHKVQLLQQLVMQASSVHHMALETIRSVLIALKVSTAMPLLHLRELYVMVVTTALRRQLTRQLYQQRQATSLKMVSLPRSNVFQEHIRT